VAARPCCKRGRANHRRVKVINLKPEQDAITVGSVARIADWPMMVFHRKVMQLEHQHTVGHEPFIVWPAVGALAPQQL